MDKLQYNTKLYNGNLSFFLAVIVPFGSVILWIYLGRLLSVPSLVGIPIAIFLFISPLIFKKKIKAIFTSKVLLEMDKDSFSVSYLDSDDERVKKQKVYLWNSIQSFDFSFGENTPILTALTFHFKKGMPKTFNFFDKEFKDDKSFKEMLKSECLLNMFYNQVKQYNATKTAEEQIQLVPGFFATKTGKIIIYLLATLIVAAIVLHLIIDPKSSFATLLISIGLVAGFFYKRKASLELYKKIKELDKE
jgi:hypothetical protein